MNVFFLLQQVFYKIQPDSIFQFKKHCRQQVILLCLLHIMTCRMGKPLCASDACFAHSILAVKLLFFSLHTRIQSACLRVIKDRVCVCISIFQVFGWVPRVFKQRLIICCCAPLHTGKVTSERCHTNTSVASCGQLIPTDVTLPSAKFFCVRQKGGHHPMF